MYKYHVPRKTFKKMVKAFDLMNIQRTSSLSVDEILVAMKGCDVSMSTRAIDAIVLYSLVQQRGLMMSAESGFEEEVSRPQVPSVASVDNVLDPYNV